MQWSSKIELIDGGVGQGGGGEGMGRGGRDHHKFTREIIIDCSPCMKSILLFGLKKKMHWCIKLVTWLFCDPLDPKPHPTWIIAITYHAWAMLVDIQTDIYTDI